MNKRYVVFTPLELRGIYATWNECKKAVDGKKCTFVGVENAEDAAVALKCKSLNEWKEMVSSKKQQALLAHIQLPAIAVDASHTGGDRMEFRGCMLLNSPHDKTTANKFIFEQGPFKHATNNIGEFLAIVAALRYIVDNCLTDTVVYSDSNIAISWVLNKFCGTKASLTDELKALIDDAMQWLAVNSKQTARRVFKWQTSKWGEIPADYGRK